MGFGDCGRAIIYGLTGSKSAIPTAILLVNLPWTAYATILGRIWSKVLGKEALAFRLVVQIRLGE